MSTEAVGFETIVPLNRQRGLAENSRGQRKRFWVECEDDPHQCHVYGFIYVNDEGKGKKRYTCSRCSKKQRYSKVVIAEDENGEEVVYERTNHGPECRFPISKLVSPTTTSTMDIDDYLISSPSIPATTVKSDNCVDQNLDVNDKMDENCSIHNGYQLNSSRDISFSDRMMKVRKPSSIWLEKSCECLQIPPTDDAYSIWSQITTKFFDPTQFPRSFTKIKEFCGPIEAGFAAISFWLTGTEDHKLRIRNELNKSFFDNFNSLGIIDGKDFGAMKHTDKEFKDVIFAEEMKNAHLATVSRILACTVVIFDAFKSEIQIFNVGQKEDGPTILLGRNNSNYFNIFSF